MNEYLKKFLHRGAIFGGFGPIVVSIVYAILEKTIDGFSLNGTEVLAAMVSSYLLAFVQAGVSVLNQIEHWSTAKSLFIHFLILYITYSGCYLFNSWIPFEPMVLLIFSVIFIVCYFVIWFSVYFAVKATSKKLNQKLK